MNNLYLINAVRSKYEKKYYTETSACESYRKLFKEFQAHEQHRTVQRLASVVVGVDIIIT